MAEVTLRKLFVLLGEQVDSGGWWPGESRFEIGVGAILTQNTAWTNVDAALTNLRGRGLLEPCALAGVPLDELGELIRPAGFYRAKSRYLHGLAEWFLTNDARASREPTDRLRLELLDLVGVGKETADDLLLYIYRRPMFIYDAYGRHLLDAAGFGTYRTYRQAKRAVDPLVGAAGFTQPELAAFHGLIVDAGKVAGRLGGWESAFPLLRRHQFGDAEV